MILRFKVVPTQTGELLEATGPPQAEAFTNVIFDPGIGHPNASKIAGFEPEVKVSPDN